MRLLALAVLSLGLPALAVDPAKRPALDLQHELALAEQEAAQEAADQRETEAEESRRKACGKDYHRLRVGMKFDRVKKCSGLEFARRGQDERGTVYEAEGGWVRVENGRVTRWMAPPE